MNEISTVFFELTMNILIKKSGYNLKISMAKLHNELFQGALDNATLFILTQRIH